MPTHQCNILKVLTFWTRASIGIGWLCSRTTTEFTFRLVLKRKKIHFENSDKIFYKNVTLLHNFKVLNPLYFNILRRFYFAPCRGDTCHSFCFLERPKPGHRGNFTYHFSTTWHIFLLIIESNRYLPYQK